MSLTFADAQTEVKARTILSQSGTAYDTQIKNALNSALFRLSRDGKWRVLRRKADVVTEAAYSTGSGAVSVTENSKAFTITGAALITAGIQVGRRINVGGSTIPRTIATITGETTGTFDVAYDGDTSTTQTYEIYGREEYNLPIQLGRVGLLWHEDLGYPYVMNYVSDLDFYESGPSLDQGNTPLFWRQWGSDTVIEQPLAASVMRITSSSSADTSKSVTVFGTVSGYPDYETIAVTGTTASSGTKSFTSVERVVKDSVTTGRITVDANSANTTIAVLPAGDATGSIEYLKLQVYPFPTRVFPIHVEYYKDPWRLVGDTDIHELGHQFDEAWILLACSKVAYAQGKTSLGDKYLLLYKDEVVSLRSMNADTIANWRPGLRKPTIANLGHARIHRYLSYSQLGGSYGPIWNGG